MKDEDTLLIEKTYEKGYFKYFAESFTHHYDKTRKKNVDDIINAPDFKQVGRITAIAFGTTWTVDMNQEACEKNLKYYQILTENPDCVIGINKKKFPRHIYNENTIIFISDKNGEGVFYGHLSDFSSHALLVREILVNKNKDAKVQIFGNVNSRILDTRKSGIVMPKQKNVDNSYISIWGDKTDATLNDMLRDFVYFLHIEPPVYLEFIAGAFNDDKFDSTGHILLVE